MADRITKSQIKSMFALFLKSIGCRPAQDYKDVGGYLLDYNPIYGGYVIERIYNTQGAIDQPFGAYRMKSQDFWYAMRFAMDAIEVKAGKR
jgi:hypothetical protein